MSIVILTATQDSDNSNLVTVTDAASAHISLFDADGLPITERVGAIIQIDVGVGSVDWVRDGRLVVLTNTNPHVHITEPGEYVVYKPLTTANIGVSRDGSGGE
jgi:hypothetical protein